MLAKFYRWLNHPFPTLVSKLSTQNESIMYNQLNKNVCPHCALSGTIIRTDLLNIKLVCESCSMQYWLHKETATELGKTVNR